MGVLWKGKRRLKADSVLADIGVTAQIKWGLFFMMMQEEEKKEGEIKENLHPSSYNYYSKSREWRARVQIIDYTHRIVIT